MTEHDRLAMRPGLLLTRIGDRVVVYDAPNRTSHVLNATAAAFLGECNGVSTLAEIAARLAASFGVTVDEVSDSLRSLLPDLEAADLLGTQAREPSQVPIGERPPPRSTLEALHGRLAAKRRWEWESAALGALRFNFDLRTDDVDLATYLEPVLASLGVDSVVEHRYVARRSGSGDPEGDALFDLTLDGHLVVHRRSATSLVSHLIWHINRMAVAATTDRVILHAAGASQERGTVILPASSESGKSTLVTALVQDGYSYLSDEALAVVPGSTTVEPFAKAITLDQGSWEVHASLRPTRPGAATFESSAWQLPPTEIRPDSIGQPAPVDLIVFPTYLAGSDTVRTPLEPVDALVELLTHCFDFDALGQPGLDTLAGLACSVPAHRLISSDLDEAVETINGLLAASGQKPAK